MFIKKLYRKKGRIKKWNYKQNPHAHKILIIKANPSIYSLLQMPS